MRGSFRLWSRKVALELGSGPSLMSPAWGKGSIIGLFSQKTWLLKPGSSTFPRMAVAIRLRQCQKWPLLDNIELTPKKPSKIWSFMSLSWTKSQFQRRKTELAWEISNIRTKGWAKSKVTIKTGFKVKDRDMARVKAKGKVRTEE